MVKKVAPPVRQQEKTRQEKSARRGFQFINKGSKACKQQATSAVDNSAPEPSSATATATANAPITRSDAPSLVKPSAPPAKAKPASPTHKPAATSESANALVDLTLPKRHSEGPISMPTAAAIATHQATGPSRDGPGAAVKAAAHPLNASDASARPVTAMTGVLDAAASLDGEMSRGGAEGLRSLPQAEVANVIEHLVQTLSPDSPLEETPSTVLPAANVNSRTSQTGHHPQVDGIKQTGQAGCQHQAPALSFRDATFSQQDHGAAGIAGAGSDASQHRLSPAGVDTPDLAQPDKPHSTNTVADPFDSTPCGSDKQPAPAHLQVARAPSATAQQPLSGAAHPPVPGVLLDTASKVAVPTGGATAEQTAGIQAAGSLAGGNADPPTAMAGASVKGQGQQSHVKVQSKGITKPKRPAQRSTAGKGLSKEAKAEAKRAEQTKNAMAMLERLNSKRKPKADQPAASPQGTAPTYLGPSGLQPPAEPNRAGGVQETEQTLAPSHDLVSQPATDLNMNQGGSSAKPLPEIAPEAATATQVPPTQVQGHRGGAQVQSRGITKPKRVAPRRAAGKGLSKEAKAEAKRAEQTRAAMALLEKTQLKNKAKEERFAVSRQGQVVAPSSSAQQALAAPSSADMLHPTEPAIPMSHDPAHQAGPGGAKDHFGKAAVPAPSLVASSAAMSRLPPTQALLSSIAEPQQQLQAYQPHKPCASKPATAAAHRRRHHSSASGQHKASMAEERAAKALRQEELIKLMRRNSASDAEKAAAIPAAPSTDRISEAEAHALAPACSRAQQDSIGKGSDARPNKATGAAQNPTTAPGPSTNQAPQSKSQLDHQPAARAPLASSMTAATPKAMQPKSSQPVASAAAAPVKGHTHKPSPAKASKAVPAQGHSADPIQLHKAAPAQAPRTSPAKVPKATPAQSRRVSSVQVTKAAPAQAPRVGLAPAPGAEPAQPSSTAPAQAAPPHASASCGAKAEAGTGKTLPSGSTATGQAEPSPTRPRPAASGAPPHGQAASEGVQSHTVTDPGQTGSSLDDNDSSDGVVEAVWKAVGVLTGVLGNGQETEESNAEQLGNRPDAQQRPNEAPHLFQDAPTTEAPAAAAKRDGKKKKRSKSLGAEPELAQKKRKKNKDTAEARQAVNQSPDLEHAEAAQQQPAASGASAVVQSMLAGSNADPDDASQADVVHADKTQPAPQQDALTQEASVAAARRDGKKKKRSKSLGAEPEQSQKKRKRNKDTAEASQAVNPSTEVERVEAAQQQPAASGASAVVQSKLGRSNADPDDASQADVASVDKTQPAPQQAAAGQGQICHVDQDSTDEPVLDQAASASQQSHNEAVHIAGSTRQAARDNKKKRSRAERKAGRAAIRAARDARKAAREAAREAAEADERLRETARMAVAIALQEAAALEAVPTGGHKTLRVRTGRKRAQDTGNSTAMAAAAVTEQQAEAGPSVPESGQEVAEEGPNVKNHAHASGREKEKHGEQELSGGNTAENAVQQKPADSKMKKRKVPEDKEASANNAELAVKQRSNKEKTKKLKTGGEKEARGNEEEARAVEKDARAIQVEARAVEKKPKGVASPAEATQQGAAARIAPSPFAAQLMEGRLNEVLATYLASSGNQAQQAAQSQVHDKSKNKHRNTSQQPGLTPDEVQARMDSWFGRIPGELYKVQQAANNNKSPEFYGAAAFMAEWLHTQLPAVLFSTQA